MNRRVFETIVMYVRDDGKGEFQKLYLYKTGDQTVSISWNTINGDKIRKSEERRPMSQTEWDSLKLSVRENFEKIYNSDLVLEYALIINNDTVYYKG